VICVWWLPEALLLVGAAVGEVPIIEGSEHVGSWPRRLPILVTAHVPRERRPLMQPVVEPFDIWELPSRTGCTRMVRSMSQGWHACAGSQPNDSTTQRVTREKYMRRGAARVGLRTHGTGVVALNSARMNAFISGPPAEPCASTLRTHSSRGRTVHT
jgi:hypothetical protein